MPVRIAGREPAEWLACVAMAVQLLVAWKVPLSEGQQASINIAAIAVMALLVALTAAREKIAAAAGGAVAALLQLAVAFGVDIDQAAMAMTGVAITFVLAFILRGQVTAPIADDGSRVPAISPVTKPPA